MGIIEYLFGTHSVKIALEQGKRKIRQLFYYNSNKSINPTIAEILELARQRNIKSQLLSKCDLNRFTHNESHQNVVLLTEPIQLSPTPKDPAKGVYIGLEGITDPHNLGSIIRTCAFFNVPVILDWTCGDLSSIVSKASAGALELYYGQDRIYREKKFADISGFELIASLPKEEIIDSFKFESIERDKRYILLVGNEGKGLRKSTIDKCLQQISIPGQFNSLNVSVATGIILHNILNK
jgi:23S rRNA (guanosine2251-2'-O)-methyltransferase